MGIRDSISNLVLGKEKQKLRESYQTLLNAYLDGPYVMSPKDLQEQLKEIDSAFLVDLVNQMGYENLGVLWMGYSEPSEAERLRAVDESRRLYRYDVITQWIIWLWTNFGFGENIEITLKDENGTETWNEFWEADRNQPLLADDSLQQLSEDLLVDGEKFLAFFISKLDGECTLRDVDTKQIIEIITHPDDSLTPLFYKRSYSSTPLGIINQESYYPDWLAKLSGVLDEEYEDPKTHEKFPLADYVLKKKGIRADQVREQTDVCMLHIAHNNKGGMRGWPLMAAAAPWSRVHKKFREDRSAVASTVAMFVNKLKVKGGSRAVDSIQAKLGSNISPTTGQDLNPQAIAGSTFLENQMADLSRLPLSTAAGDAKADGEALLLMAGLGGGVYPHWMGAGDAYRLATASSMESPMYREFSRYQKFWGAQFRKMIRIVFWAASTYGGKTLDDPSADVSTDKLLQTDAAAFSSSLASIFGTIYGPYVTNGLIPQDTAQKLLATAWTLALETLGVSNTSDLTSNEAFGVGKPIKPIPGVQPQGIGGPQPKGGGQEIKGPQPTPKEAAIGSLIELRDRIRAVREGMSGNGHK